MTLSGNFTSEFYRIQADLGSGGYRLCLSPSIDQERQDHRAEYGPIVHSEVTGGCDHEIWKEVEQAAGTHRKGRGWNGGFFSPGEGKKGEDQERVEPGPKYHPIFVPLHKPKDSVGEFGWLHFERTLTKDPRLTGLLI